MSDLHTPGPWAARGLTVFPGKETALSVAVVTQHRREAGANARLIAAAPDMLEALQLVWDTYGLDERVDSVVWQVVRAAISKATTP